jgi:bifunctional non-homologous end joining protein LigD
MDESISLWCQQGSSDKVYHAQLTEVPGQGWTVTCQYGARGGTMNRADKEPNPVPYAKAKKSYDKIVKEKLAKGYQITSGAAPAAAPAPVGTAAPVVRKTKPVVASATMRPQLLNEVEADEVEAYLTDPNWLAQEKFDGERVFLMRDMGGNLGSISARSGKERLLSEAVASALEAADLVLLVDGEQVGEVFHLFDVLESGVSNHRSRSVEERLAILAELHAQLPAAIFPPTYTARTEAEKRALLAELDGRNAEGIVFKRADATYSAGRPNSGGDWVKCKFWSAATVEVEAVNAKRSVAMRVYDTHGNPHSIGNVTVKPAQAIPQVGDLIEVAYLYFDRSLVQPELIGPRTDLTRKSAMLKQLKRKPSGLHAVAVQPEALAA